MLLEICIVIFCFIGTAIISLSEAAFFAFPIDKIKAQGKDNENCKNLIKLREKFPLTISSLVISHAFLGLMATICLSQIQTCLNNPFSLIVPYFILEILFCEFLGKVYGFVHAEKIAIRFTPFMNFLNTLLAPLSLAFSLFASLFGIKLKNNTENT